MLKKLLAFTCLTLSIGAATSHAAIIYSGSLPRTAQLSPDLASDGRLFVRDNTGSGLGTAEFPEALSASVVGTTFTYNTGVVFDTAVEILTNGLDDLIAGFAGGSGPATLESDFFSTVSLNGTDLAGFSIDSLQWTIDSFVYDSVNERVLLESSLTVNGQSVVPIPAAAWLFGSALLGLGAMKRKKA
jgi:hypothetical protein